MRFYTVEEVADLVKLSRGRVYEAIRLNLLPAVHIGRQVRIEEQSFQAWVAHGGKTHPGRWKRQAS